MEVFNYNNLFTFAYLDLYVYEYDENWNCMITENKFNYHISCSIFTTIYLGHAHDIVFLINETDNNISK